MLGAKARKPTKLKSRNKADSYRATTKNRTATGAHPVDTATDNLAATESKQKTTNVQVALPDG